MMKKIESTKNIFCLHMNNKKNDGFMKLRKNPNFIHQLLQLIMTSLLDMRVYLQSAIINYGRNETGVDIMIML